MNGGDLYALKGILGHKSIAMTQRYAHLSTPYQRAMVDRMEAIWAKPVPAQVEKVVPLRDRSPRRPAQTVRKPVNSAALSTSLQRHVSHHS